MTKPTHRKTRRARFNCEGLYEMFYGPFGNGPGGAFSKKRGKYKGFVFKEKVQHETQNERELREARARALCNSCAYLEPCREFALINQEEFGVWGGMTEGERRDFRTWCRIQGYEEIPIRPFLNEYLEEFWLDRYGQEVEISRDGSARIRPLNSGVRNRDRVNRAKHVRKRATG